MSFILMLIGLYLYFAGRIDLGTIRAEGRPVKTAGMILIAPGAVSFLLNFIFVPFAFGNNQSAASFFIGIVNLLDLLGSMLAVALAYLLIVNPPNVPRLPGILGEIQDDSRPLSNGSDQPTERSESQPPPTRPTTPQPRSRTVTIPTPGQTDRPRPTLNRDRFPPVMDLKDAARYLQTTEEEILKLIDEGKLVAARDNYNYQIAKSQLDELL